MIAQPKLSEDDLDWLSILADSAISRSKFSNSLNADMIFDHLVNGVRNSRRRLEGAYPFLPIPLSEMSVLDIGCGSGAASVAIQNAGAKQVTSFDLNRDPLGIDFALSRRNVHGVPRDLLLANGYQLPFGRCSFDLAWCEYVVEHVSELGKLLSEAIRVLKPNGLMYIVTNNAWWPREPHSGLWWASWMPHKVAARYARWRNHWPADQEWDIFLPTRNQLLNEARAAGFTVVASSSELIAGHGLRILNHSRIFKLKIFEWILPNLYVLLRKPSY